MTDAERIAALMNRMDLRESPNWTASQVERRAIADSDSIAATIMAILSAVRREERMLAEERCLDILVIVGIAAMEAGHTNVGKYIAAASTKIRASK